MWPTMDLMLLRRLGCLLTSTSSYLMPAFLSASFVFLQNLQPCKERAVAAEESYKTRIKRQRFCLPLW